MVSGYPVGSDPAAFCKAKILGNRYPMQDPTMAHGVECAQLLPSGGKFPKGSSSRRPGCHFAAPPSSPLLKHLLKEGEGGCSRMAELSPTALGWRDTKRKHRGAAWMFFPSRPAGPTR